MLFRKKFSLLFTGTALIAILAIAPLVFAAPPGASQLKIFTRDRSAIESAVNEWLESQQNITVDQVRASAYGNDYAVIISYREGGSGKVATRIKIFDSNALTNNAGEGDETPEMRGQEFVSLLGQNQIIRSADILVGSGPWDIFVVYDEFNPIPSVTSEAPSVPIIEKIKQFIENVVSPPAGETSSETPIAPTEEPPATEEPTAATTTVETPAAADTSTTTEEQGAATSTETSPAPTEEIPAAPAEESTTTEEQGEVLGAALIFSLTASIFDAAGSFLFKSNLGAIVFLILVLAVIYFGNKILRKWEDSRGTRSKRQGTGNMRQGT